MKLSPPRSRNDTRSCVNALSAFLAIAFSLAPALVPTLSAGTCVGFSENFDGVTAPALPTDWVATNDQGPAPLWVTSTGTPETAPNDAFVDDPGVVSDKRLDTPSLTVSSASPQITFRHPDHFIFIDADLKIQTPAYAGSGGVTQSGKRK